MTTYRTSYQRDFVEHIVFLAVQMTKPLPADLAHRDNVAGRSWYLVSSILCDLEGDGGTEQHRLSRKGEPHVDLMEAGLRGQWLRGKERDGGAADEFLTALLGVYAKAQTVPDPTQALGQLLIGLSELIENSYELVPHVVDDDGKWLREALDIAPGLAAAVESAWADRDAIAV